MSALPPNSEATTNKPALRQPEKGIRYSLRSKTFAAENDDERINRGAYEHKAAKQHTKAHRFFRHTRRNQSVAVVQ